MHQQVQVGFNRYLADIKQLYLQGAWYHARYDMNFTGAISYLNYGSVPVTDIAGNIWGDIYPRDYTIQVGMSKSYMTKWNYGLTAKFVHSNPGNQQSSALALDAGVNYRDSTNSLQTSLVLKNFGWILTNQSVVEDYSLPFDIQLGFTYRLKEAPVQLSLQTYRFPAIKAHQNDYGNDEMQEYLKPANFFNSMFRHIILSGQLMIEEKVAVNMGYNYLRRIEMSDNGRGVGLNGFSMGVGLYLSRFQLNYAITSVQKQAWHQLGLGLMFNEWSGKQLF